jgi:hypothetical protein
MAGLVGGDALRAVAFAPARRTIPALPAVRLAKHTRHAMGAQVPDPRLAGIDLALPGPAVGDDPATTRAGMRRGGWGAWAGGHGPHVTPLFCTMQGTQAKNI